MKVPTEMTYASDVKEWLNNIFKELNLKFKKCRVEEKDIKTQKRADIIVYDENNTIIIIIEIKTPDKSASDFEVRDQALNYAKIFKNESEKLELKYIATHNVNEFYLWDVKTEKRIENFQVSSMLITELSEYQKFEDDLIGSLKKIFIWIDKYINKSAKPRPLDEGIVEIIHSRINYIANNTKIVDYILHEQYEKEKEFREYFKSWLVDQGFPDPKTNENLLYFYCEILAKQYIYMFTNKVMFYNILLNNYKLPKFTIPEGLSSNNFKKFIEPYYDEAYEKTGDYKTIFKTNFVDSIKVSTESINEFRKLANFLEGINYEKMPFDIIGKIFEKLIPREERQHLGQFFTRSDIVDIILAFCVKDVKTKIMDPACGTGTFLVRAYNRLIYLGNKKKHMNILNQLYGVDIAKFPVHLATINLAIRDIKSDKNYPRIIYKDFFDMSPKMSVEIGAQKKLSKWLNTDPNKVVNVSTLDDDEIKIDLPQINAIIGNPPFTRQEELKGKSFGNAYKKKLSEAIDADYKDLKLNQRAGIYAYFIPHAASFIKWANGQRLGFVVLRSWMDVNFGKTLKQFLLDNFNIIAIIQSLNEKWFSDAQMIPCIIILETETRKTLRESNQVKFIQIKKDLNEIFPVIVDQYNKLEEIEHWDVIDGLVEKIENFPKENLFSEEIQKYKRYNILDSPELRILSLFQKHLKAEEKWGFYLTAPIGFFKIIGKDDFNNIFCSLKDICEINTGLKTGANSYFYFPNSTFKIKEFNDTHLIIRKKGRSSDLEYKIELEYIKPILIKFKKQQNYRIDNIDGYCLVCNKTKSQLRAEGSTGVLDYIKYGEENTDSERKRNFSERTVCRNRGRSKSKEWYYQSLKKIGGPLLHSEAQTVREVTLLNLNTKDDVLNLPPLANYGLYSINPTNIDNTKIIWSLLNSTLGNLMIEFGGRYKENRDGTITNETRIGDLENINILNPDRIPSKIKKEIIECMENVSKRETKKIWEEFENDDKRELDKKIFLDYLGITNDELEEIYKTLAEIAKIRNTPKD